MSIWKSLICFLKLLLVFDCQSTFEIFYIILILIGFKNISMVITCTLNGLGWRFPSIYFWKVYCVKLYQINILKLRAQEKFYSVVQKYLISSRYSSLYCVLYKTSDMVGLIKTVKPYAKFGPIYSYVLQGTIIYTYGFFLGNLYVITINFYLNLYIDLCLLLTSLSDGVIFLHYDSCQVYTIIDDTSPLSNPVQEINKHAFFTQIT